MALAAYPVEPIVAARLTSLRRVKLSDILSMASSVAMRRLLLMEAFAPSRENYALGVHHP